MTNAFDPAYYDPKTDYQREPGLTDAEWTDRFIAYMTTEGMKYADDSFKAELPEYARGVAPSYLDTRKEYIDPEEAAWTDISYWEEE